MPRPKIHQLIVSASEGDAISQMALDLRDRLREKSESEVFAKWIHSDRLRDEVKLLDQLPKSNEVDLLVYHASIGLDEINSLMKTRSEQIVIAYHNITPGDMYREFNPEFAHDLDLGRTELHELREKTTLVIADSIFNSKDIETYGYSNVSVIPAGFKPHRLHGEIVDAPLVRTLWEQFPNGYVLVVGQVLPHKRVEQTIEAVHLLNSTYHTNLGLVICGAQRQSGYLRAITEHLKSFPFVGVRMTGPVTDQHLATYYRAATLYLGMSDHEGLCIPPVEAMSFRTPVVIKGSGAVPETLGDGAFVLPSNAGPVAAAEAMYEVLNNHPFRAELIHRALRRVHELESRNSSLEASRVLLELIK